MKIYLVAGEISGDVLGGGLISALRARYPQAEFRGLGGEQMQAAGLHSLYPLETLSVMGLVEVLKHLPRLLKVRRHLYQDALEWGADLMVGIDAPDFNIGLERKLHRQGVKTAHYVSPSVWAWRSGRIKKLKQSIDLMLTLFPFEVDFYQQHQLPAVFVGHPTADRLPLQPDKAAARQHLKLPATTPVLALLPGSRSSEIERLAPLFLATASRLKQRLPNLQLVLPTASDKSHQRLQQFLAEQPVNDLQVVRGQADIAMQAADACLLASGTATLEALFCKCPMVIAYKLAPLTWWLVSRMVKVKWVGLPNLLSNSPLVSERLQNAATTEHLVADLQCLLTQPEQAQQQVQAFHALHQTLRRNASETAAEALARLLPASTH